MVAQSAPAIAALAGLGRDACRTARFLVVDVDAGACAALLRGASLLPGGVRGVTGEFRRGDVIEVRAADGTVLARGQAQYSARDGARIAGRHSREIEAVLGFHYDEAMIHRDDLVLLHAAGHPAAEPQGETNGETTA